MKRLIESLINDTNAPFRLYYTPSWVGMGDTLSSTESAESVGFSSPAGAALKCLTLMIAIGVAATTYVGAATAEAQLSHPAARAAQASDVQVQVQAVAEFLPIATFRQWMTAVDELASYGPEAVPPLVEALWHPDRNVRTAAAHALARITGASTAERSAEVAAAYLQIASDPSATVEDLTWWVAHSDHSPRAA